MGLWFMHQGMRFLCGYNHLQWLAVGGSLHQKQLPRGHAVLCYHRGDGEGMFRPLPSCLIAATSLEFWLPPPNVSNRYPQLFPAQPPCALCFDHSIIVSLEKLSLPYSQPIWFGGAGSTLRLGMGQVTQV